LFNRKKAIVPYPYPNNNNKLNNKTTTTTEAQLTQMLKDAISKLKNPLKVTIEEILE
jgi:hypothetical protein